MLVGFNDQPDQKVSRYLRTSHFSFYLTGSRFFGDIKPTSDWDFFVQNDEHVPKFLSHHGFGLLHVRNTDYTDEQTVFVYRHIEAKIDVQLVEDASLKWRTQQYIFESPVLLRLYKDMKAFPDKRDAFWNLVYAIHSGKVASNCRQLKDSVQEGHNWMEQVRKFISK